MLADRLHWTPETVDALDPDFVDELLIYLEADAAHTRKMMRERERS